MAIKVAFDVDGTLIGYDGIVQDDVVELLHHFLKLGCDVHVWSGGGLAYVRGTCERLGIDKKVKMVTKGAIVPDIAFDDQDVTLGKANIKVQPRI